jgi:hypothetical protein
MPLTPKEQTEWDNFTKMCEAAGNETDAIPLLRMELERLASKGNPAAQRLQERIAAASYAPRKPGEAAKLPQKRTRIGVKVAG